MRGVVLPVISFCASFMFFLNSRIPLPNEPAMSGMRLAPKKSRTTAKIRMSSPIPKLNGIGAS